MALRLNPNTGHLTGQAGVWRVASELALRGWTPHFPGVDFGYDLTIDHGTRIQVKSTQLKSYCGFKGPIYAFGLTDARPNRRVSPEALRQRYVKRMRCYSERCDFVVLHGVTENRYWIVPAVQLDGAFGIYVTAEHVETCNELTNEDAEQVKVMLASGMKQSEVAEHFGVQQMTISRISRGVLCKPSRNRARNVRKLENRWDLIEDFIRTVKCPVPGAMEAVLEQGALV